MPPPSSALQNDVTYAGWIYKEGSMIKSWKKRFLVVKKNEIAYYKNVNAKSTAQLLGALVVAKIEFVSDIPNGIMVTTGVHGRKSHHNALPQQTNMDVKRVGWLEKEGQHFKTWKKRYFTLTNDILVYSNAIGGETLGVGRVIATRRDPSRAFTLVVSMEGGRELRIGGKSDFDADEWVDAIQEGIHRAQELFNLVNKVQQQNQPSKKQNQKNKKNEKLAPLSTTAYSSSYASRPARAAADDDHMDHLYSSPQEEDLKTQSFRGCIQFVEVDNKAGFIEYENKEDGRPFSPKPPSPRTIKKLRLAYVYDDPQAFAQFGAQADSSMQQQPCAACCIVM